MNRQASGPVSPRHLIRVGAVAAWIVCIGDFVVSFLLAAQIPGYDPMAQSESVMGSSTSPVAGWVTAWGVAFSLLFLMFSLGFFHAFSEKGKAARAAAWMLLLYGLGEGIGSGFLPFDFVNGKLTLSGQLHNLISGIGDTGLIFMPLVARKVFTLRERPRMHTWSLLVFLVGMVFIILFLATKFIGPGHGLFSYRGLWQRLYLLDYYLYLMAGALVMFKKPLHPGENITN